MSFDNAFQMLWALPLYYAKVAFTLPPEALTVIPAVGLLGLVSGFTVSALKKDVRMIAFAIPFGASELIVSVSGLFHGRLQNPVLGALLLVFLGLQVAICAWLIWRLRSAWLSAFSLSVFSVSYALFAVFMAGMSFSDTWI